MQGVPWIPLGIAIGVGMGVAFREEGIAIGIAVGAGIGVALQAYYRERD